MTVCGGWSIVKHDSNGTRAITLWCRSWQCADCMPFRLAALKRMATNGNPSTFLTLTVNPATGQSVEDRAQKLVDAMRTMIKRARRKFRKAPIEYLAVFEETKKGEPHLHMLMRAPYVPQRWISEVMNELISAPIVDIRKVHNQRLVAKYVAKYVAKGPKSFGQLKRYWSTKGYDQEQREADEVRRERASSWHPVQEPLFIVAEGWRTFGRLVEWVSAHEIFSGIGPAWRAPDG